MGQKRRQYRNTPSGLEEQLVASHATIVDIDSIDGLDATNVQDALEELKDKAASGGVTGVKGSAENSFRKGDVNITAANIGLGNVTNDAQVKRSEMGAAGGVAQLDTTGKVPASQLPSYVDDVVEIAVVATDSNGRITKIACLDENSALKEITALSGVIYLHTLDGVWGHKATNKMYRWSGSYLAEISSSLALGETSSTAYAGDKGKANADNIATLQSEMSTAKTDISNAKTDISNIKDGTTKVKKAESADKLATARTLSFTGDATGSASFDGSANKEITLTLANSGVTAGTYSVVQVDAKGRVTAGNQIIEYGTSGQTTPSTNLAIGGIFFELIG